MGNFQRGSKAAAVSGGDFSSRAQFFKLEDGEQVVVRFLTDPEPVESPNGDFVGGWITVNYHQNIPTKGAPAGYDSTKSWPARMAAVCRHDPALSYSDCYICDVLHKDDPKSIKKPAKRTWAAAVLREEVKEDGKVVGYRDQTRTVTRKNSDGTVGETFEEPAVVNLNFGWKNFFSALETNANINGGTLLDRDYLIIRKGADVDTVYIFMALDRVPHSDGTTFDVRKPEHMVKYFPSALTIGSAAASDEYLIPIIEGKAADDYFATFFDRTVVASSNNSPVSSGTPSAAPVNDAANEELEALRARVRGYPSPAAEATSEDEKPLVRAFD